MIDIRDYDLAVIDRVKTFYKNTHWVNRPTLPLQELRDRKVLEGKDVEFPIITVRRTNCPMFSKDYNSWSRAKSGQTYVTGNNGVGYKRLQDHDPELAMRITDTGHNDVVSVVNSTFDLTYYIDVISLERDNFDTLMVELQENFFTIPYLGFYNFKTDGSVDRLVKDQACHFTVEEIEDTSDLENFDSGNALYRATVTVKINAYIYRKFKQNAVEQFKISSNVVPNWLAHKGYDNFGDYLQSNEVAEKLGLLGYKNLLDYLHHLGYESLEEFLEAFNKGDETSVIIDLSAGPDGIILVFKIPPKLDNEMEDSNNG